MKYLKYFESFYSPVTKTYKSNIGNDYMNDTGGNTYPLNNMNIDEYDVAYKKGQEAFGKDETNPYVDQEYPNTELIKAFNDGLKNAKVNKTIKEDMYVDSEGELNFPDYLRADYYNDTLDTAFDKGAKGFHNGIELGDNPFREPDLAVAWRDGFLDAENSHKNAMENN